MKRHWRPVRIILAVLFLSIAGLVIFLWPQGPRWRMPAEEILGFDDQKQVLLTIKDQESETKLTSEISAWDIENGQKKYSLTCQTKKNIRLTRDRGRLLSPNAAYLADWGYGLSYSIQVVQLAEGKTIHEFQIDDHSGFLDTIGFSKDSRFLAAK